ncbi:delta-60 repeat domain-containing protein [Deinococcus yavapaiensis]|uniref:Putative delta-60 repeat protein n=1 Tax=Deinococcus yavapaiensis KR-236 TaxID=694435 RepID=A0A318S7I3_9DEIO|nr:delta-60 repeat domain-containing protein [Deinococcus yavapaiensis]PYE52999.1 putative delta-60 repeat protein [Deinococcus yavapaiensis KR-236]
MRRSTLLGLCLFVSACSTQPTPNVVETGPRVLGLVEVTAGEQATVKWVAPDADTLSALDLSSIPAGLDVQVVPTTIPYFDANGTRYLYSQFKVRNGKGSIPNSDLKNVTFLALDNTTTLGDTAIVSMRNAAGASITSVDVARSLRPTHRMDTSSVVQALGADLQLFSESDVSAFANSFPWGFGVRHCLDVNCDAYDKTLPGNPALNQFDGRVTLAFKTPITTSANTPKSASMLYLVVADNTTNARVVQSSEEQLTGTVAGKSTVPTGFDLVKLPGSGLPGGTQLGNVRVAGTASTTTTTLLTRPSLTASNATLQQGQAVTYAVSGSDPQGSALTYSVSSGTLPAGLTLNASTGAVSGTPSSYGTSSVTFRATNASGEFDEKIVTLTVTATPPSVTVGNQSLTQGQSANFTVTASDPQDLTLTYSLAQGSTLPVGLSLNASTGVVSGTPTVFGTFPVTFQVTNSGGGTTSKTVTLSVTATAPSITLGNQSLTQGQAANFNVTASDPQNLSLTYSLAQGSTLLAGLSLDGSTGVVSGTPSVFGTFPVTFQVTNSGGASATKTITLTITATPPSVTVGNQTLLQGQSANFTVTASDPQSLSLTYSLAQGSTLPAGLSLNGSTGVVSGTPSTAGTTSVTFQVTNSGGGTASKTITITVNSTSGLLDTTFGTGGKVTTPVGTSTDDARTLVMQPDGKLVAAGYTFNGSNFDFALVRYNSNGTLDTTFGSGGKITTPIGTSHDVAFALVVQSDGKLVAAGYTSNGTNDDFALVRYNSNGSLDTTFGTNGKVTTDFGMSADFAYALVVQPDGKLVAAGATYNGSNSDLALVRYNSNGSLDTTFGTSGKVTTPIGTSDDQAHALVMQPDGKLVAAGQASNGSNNDFALVRYNSNGTLDTTFGSGGKITTTSYGIAHALVMQSDGKLIAAGETYNGSTYDFALVRYNSNGTLDTTFGANGKVTPPVGTSQDRAYALVMQPDGKLVAAGYASNGTNYDFALVRYNSNGTLDTTFGTNGKVTTDFGMSGGIAFALVVQSDGKLVAAGYSYSPTYDFALVRYLP